MFIFKNNSNHNYRFPECMEEIQKKPFLLAHLLLAKCYDKQITYSKEAKLKNILECKKYYKVPIQFR